MKKSDLISVLDRLKIINLTDSNADITSQFKEKYQEVCSELNCTYADITLKLPVIKNHYFSDDNILEWRYLTSILFVLSKIGDFVETCNHEEILSVKETNIVKSAMNQLTKLGIYTKLQPKLPFYINKQYTDLNDIFFPYNVLKCTILIFCEFLHNTHLRVLLLKDTLRGMLVGLYQIAYCPLNKNNNSILTEEIYNRLLKEKEMATHLIMKLRESIYPSIYVKETMVIFNHHSPPWFKKAVSQTLTNIMCSPCGIKNITIAMLDGTENDKTKTWKAFDILFRLILSCKKRADFKKNICQQVIELIDDESDEDQLILERLFVICTKNIYIEDKELSKDFFVRKIVTYLLHFTNTNFKVKEEDITGRILKHIRLVYGVFVENTVESKCLPTEILKPVLKVIFRWYSMTLKTVFKEENQMIKELLVKFLSDYPQKETVVFDSFLFDIDEPFEILAFRKDIILNINGKSILLNFSDHSIISSASENSDSILELLKNNTRLLTRFFCYVLKCLGKKDKYFKKSNEELLSGENEILNEYFERKLVTYKILSVLTEDKNIQRAIVKDPEEIVIFIKDVLEKTIETNMHKTTEFERDDFQTIFIIVMILHALVSCKNKTCLETCKILIKPLEIIKKETKNSEIAKLIENILHNIGYDEKHWTLIDGETPKSKLDLILEDICDPLLPIRGHGLMALKKLVEKKDVAVMEKKQYIITIFQQNLKNDDSFIYLSAIDGLVAMTDVLPDTVLNTLCEEYSDFNKNAEDGTEVRIKLGEVLVRVTRKMGEMAQKYKSLLLNTVLLGTKDDDHLIRASSLSNLGEICRVLGYKLGTIITEVLVCVHAIIATDKAVEARRAAVTVIRQLLAGLESEMISFLKEDILPIYRTLKQIYLTDKDDVMRLQAQLALEELNENMKTFVFPKPQINTDKKIIMLN